MAVMFVGKAVKSSLCWKNRVICEYLLTKIRVLALLEWMNGPFTRALVAGRHILTKGERHMAKLTKTATIAAIADSADISKAQAKAALEALAGLAYKNAKDGFTIPGLGKVSIRQTKARKMIMRFGPRTGEEVDVPAKKKLKFTYLKAAKEAIGI